MNTNYPYENGYCPEQDCKFDDDKPHRPERDCEGYAIQLADISIPLEICPDAKLGKIETECCGEPYIQCEHEPCGSNLNIVITQSVKVKIPVKFGIKTIEGNGFIKCSDDDCCCK